MIKIGIKDYIIAILIILLIGTNFNDSPSDNSKGSSYEQLSTNVVRAETKIVDEVVIPKMSTEIESRVEKDDVKMFGKIENVVKGNLSGNKSNNTKPVIKYKREKKDIVWKYEKDGNALEFPIGTTIYNPNAKSDSKWKSIAYGLKFETSIVQQKKYDGTYETYIETWATHKNLKEKHGGGGKYPLEISDAQFQIVDPKSLTWSWWNPTASLGLATTSIDNNWAAVKFNFMNMGYVKEIPVYQFMSPLLLIATNESKVGIELVSANIGQFLPIIKDLHVGAGILIPDMKTPTITLTTVF